MINNIKFDITNFVSGVEIDDQRFERGVRETKKTINKAVIIHQVNCMGAMGAGVALAIKNKWPIAGEKYKEYVDSFAPRERWKLLGQAHAVHINDDLVIYNLFGQYDYRSEGRKTEYSALANALKVMIGDLEYDYKREGSSILIPDLIGCGLAGGDKNVVMDIIKTILGSYKSGVYICSL